MNMHRPRSAGASTAVRMGALLQLGEGTLLLSQPTRLLRLTRTRSGPAEPWIVRLLGARLLLQATAVLVRPTRGVLRAATSVDALHGLSMLVVARYSRRFRRLALLSAAAAAAGMLPSAGALSRPV